MSSCTVFCNDLACSFIFVISLMWFRFLLNFGPDFSCTFWSHFSIPCVFISERIGGGASNVVPPFKPGQPPARTALRPLATFWHILPSLRLASPLPRFCIALASLLPCLRIAFASLLLRFCIALASPSHRFRLAFTSPSPRFAPHGKSFLRFTGYSFSNVSLFASARDTTLSKTPQNDF